MSDTGRLFGAGGKVFDGGVGEWGWVRGGNGEDLRMCVFRSVVYMLWLKTETYWGGFVSLSRITTTFCNGSPCFSRPLSLFSGYFCLLCAVSGLTLSGFRLLPSALSHHFIFFY